MNQLHLVQSLFVLSTFLSTVNSYEVVDCYWAQSERLPQDGSTDAYIPCGEVDDGTQSCCRVGHTCLEASACYAPEAGMVYTAGCTDSSYSSDRCPSKCQNDAYWIGHSYCNGTSNQWSCCSNHLGDTSNDEQFPFNNKEACWCPEEDPSIAFSAPSKIPDVALLKLDDPGSISYFPGHTPTGEHVHDAKSTARKPQSPSADAPQPTSPAEKSHSPQSPSEQEYPPSSTSSSIVDNAPVSENSQLDSTNSSDSFGSADTTDSMDSTGSADSTESVAPTDSSQLSMGAKIGIGIGVGLGIPLIIILFWLGLKQYRISRGVPPPKFANHTRAMSFPDYDCNDTQAENEKLNSPTESGHRSEMAADDNTSSPLSTAPQTNWIPEVEGHPPQPDRQPYTTRPRPPNPTQSSYQPLNPSNLSHQSPNPPYPRDQTPNPPYPLSRPSSPPCPPHQPPYDANSIKPYTGHHPAPYRGLQMPSIHEMPP